MNKKTKTIIAVVTISALVVAIFISVILYKFSSKIVSIMELGGEILSFSWIIPVYIAHIYFELTAEIPPEPSVTYAEFPYEIVCRYDGEVYTEQGNYICEYEGVEAVAYFPTQNELRWNAYIEGTMEDDVILFKNDEIIVYCDIGEPQYYMGVPEFTEVPEPELYCEILPEGYIVSKTKHPESFEKVCGASIISYELSEPIENTYVPKKWYEFWK